MSKNLLPFYTSDVFSFSLHHGVSHTKLMMQMHTKHVTTKNMPHVYTFLQKYMPGVLETQCFNDKHISFPQEVINTELGHLFEHMLLTQLLTLTTNKKRAYNGLTSWNWKKDTYGLFRITVDAGKNEQEILLKALNETTKAFEACIKSHSYDTIRL